jgi:hypothetical protein
MRFFEVVLSGAALVSTALAVEFNSWPAALKAGSTVTLTYSPKDAATTIILRKGPSDNLDTLDTLTTTSTGGSFEWTVPSDLANGADYAFEIRQAGDKPNYSGQIPLTGGSASASASASSSASKTESESSTKGYSTAESTSASATESSSFKTTASPSASSSIMPSHGANSTVLSHTPSATKPVTTGTPSGENPPENTGAAASFGASPVALFMGAAAALAFFA